MNTRGATPRYNILSVRPWLGVMIRHKTLSIKYQRKESYLQYVYAPSIIIIQDKNSDRTDQAKLCIPILSDELK